ncbi:4Fe-4S dicluster domain-containing protein [Lachnoclostridium sp. Marseille-P6806]|uniref:4Fe-4S dicluster domain-containing protein n=1 Tax=Lachnoclostridium sp. Marseille-P6806 TaxID=2364793 RepID=UPI001A9303E7|nr:4Fe-4S dicluster domain-containing protein [Lachnoclostridium sp. Marseille-P6806]
MGMEERTHFRVDQNKRIGCGNCVNVCTGMVLSMRDGHPEMKPFERFGWRGCWRCDRCIAV